MATTIRDEDKDVITTVIDEDKDPITMIVTLTASSSSTSVRDEDKEEPERITSSSTRSTGEGMQSVSITDPTSAITTPPGPLATWTGEGRLLISSCSIPEWSLIDLSTAYIWAPVVGCMHGKPGCCPFVVSPTATAPITSNPTATALPAKRDVELAQPFPVANGPAQTVLLQCPDDYEAVGSGCCPSGYTPHSTRFGLQIACMSSVTPPFPAASMTFSHTRPVEVMSTAIFALHYQVRSPPPAGGLSMGAKAGIGAGVGILVAIFLAGLVAFIAFRRRKKRMGRTSLTEIDSTVRDKGSVPRWRPELDSSAVGSPIDGPPRNEEKSGKNWFADLFPGGEIHPARRRAELP